MKAAWLLVVCVILVQGDIMYVMARTDPTAVLQSLVSNLVQPGIIGSRRLEDFTVAVDEWSAVDLTRLHLNLSPNVQTLKVKPDFNSSIITFSCAGGSASIFGLFKLRNSSTFTSKGSLIVNLTSLELSGAANLLLDENCMAVHDCELTYEFHGIDVKFLHYSENRVEEVNNLTTAQFLSSFKEHTHDGLVKVIKSIILADLNSALCSVPIKTLLGGEEEERSYRKSAIKNIPNLNDIIDTILDNLRPVIHKQGFDILNLPDVNTTFNVKESIFKLNGRLLAENGSIGNLTKVHRTSDCMLAGNGSFFVANGGFGIDKLNVTYNNVDATFENLEFTGRISVAFEIVSIYFKANMSVINSTCYPSLSYIHVNKLDKISVEVEGNRSWMVREIILLAFDRYKNKVVTEIDSLLENLGKKYLKAFDCRSIFGVTSNYLVP